MKKRISIVLALLLLISAFYPCQALISDEMNRKSVSLFCNSVMELNDKYEFSAEDYEYHYNQNNPNATENRLIIKTNTVIRDTDAVASVSGLEYTILQFEDKQTMEKAYDELSQKGYSVTKDRVLSVTDLSIKNFRTENDNFDEISEMWAYESVMSDYAKAQIEQSSAYDNEIVVGVLDTGVDYNQQLLNGRITDTTFNMSFSGKENDCMDDNGHGTAVAGVIALSTPDNVKIKPYKVLDADGSVTLSEFTAAMEVILASKDLPDIMNVSMGGNLFAESMSIETELINRLVDKGVTVCVASGNDNLPVEYCTPADSDKAITVGAYDYTNHICSFSNYGKAVDIAAPGFNIYSVKFDGDISTIGGEPGVSGTSFACPFVSAACAYILMQNTELSPSEIKQRIKDSAIDMGEDEREYFGSGMLSFPNLLNEKVYSVPEPDIQGGFFTDTQTVSFENIPADTQLIYTLDKSVPGISNATVYTAPIAIDNEMQLNYALVQNGRYVSNISSQYYTIQYLADENDFEITDAGVISAYNGSKNNIIVPDTIQGVVPVQIGNNFSGNSEFTSVVLPDSVTKIAKGFSAYYELKHFTGENLQELGGNTFNDCFSLRDAVMTNLKIIGSHTFYCCSMLHQLTFENSLQRFGSYAFYATGLLSADFKNLDDYITKNNRAQYAFQYSSLLRCSLNTISRIVKGFFDSCNFLQEVHAPAITSLGTYAFVDCFYLNEFDMLNVTEIDKGAFCESYIDTLYAPRFTTFKTGSGLSGLGMNCYSRVINFPAIISLPDYAFSEIFAEEVYLEKTETMESSSFYAVPNLNILYMPSVKAFSFPKSNSVGPMELIWVPNAKSTPTIPMQMNDTKLFFAPKTDAIYANVGDTVLVVSENFQKTTQMEVGLEWIVENKGTTFIAPQGSYAENLAASMSEAGKAVSYFDVKDVEFVELDDNEDLVYIAGEKEIKIPFFFVENYWDTSSINEADSNASYLFVFDFNNDNVINAKDYAILFKLKNQTVT